MEHVPLAVVTASEVLRHRTVLGVTNRPGLRFQVLTQRRDSLEGPRLAAVWIRKEGRRNATLVVARVAGETASSLFHDERPLKP